MDRHLVWIDANSYLTPAASSAREDEREDVARTSSRLAYYISNGKKKHCILRMQYLIRQ